MGCSTIVFRCTRVEDSMKICLLDVIVYFLAPIFFIMFSGMPPSQGIQRKSGNFSFNPGKQGERSDFLENQRK